MGCQNTKQHIRNLEYTMKKGERVINIKVETREDIVKKLELLKSVISDFKQKIKDFEEDLNYQEEYLLKRENNFISKVKDYDHEFFWNNVELPYYEGEKELG